MMEEGTGAMNITTTRHEGRHGTALLIGAFGRSQSSTIRVTRLKRVAVACVQRHPMADGLGEKTGLVSPATLSRRAESYHTDRHA